jgi:hypothetical protein
MSRVTSRRTSGSPPVTRSLRTPKPIAIDATRSISSKVRIASCGYHTGSSGMQ